MAFAALALLAACQPEIDKVAPKGAELNFTKYVAVGNSLTAGFADNGLDYYRQINSYPNFIAEQMRKLKPDLVFNQPLFEMGSTGTGYLTLNGISATGSPVTTFIPGATSEVTDSTATLAGKLPNYNEAANITTLNNLGVPGFRLSDINIGGIGAINPLGYNFYLERMLADDDATRFLPYVSYVRRSNATFFTNWLGNNDVLGYATSGAAGSSLTPTATFAMHNSALIDSLMLTANAGLVATIPYVSSTPFFTTIPYNPLPLSDAQAAQVNEPLRAGGYFAGLKLYNSTRPADDQLDTSAFTVGQNAPLVQDKDLPPPLNTVGRKLRPDEYLLLTTPTSEFATGMGTQRPVPDRYVLTRAEIKEIKARTDEFNVAIRSKANEKGLAIFEAGALLETLATTSGISYDGIKVTTRFISGGVFSLDGVHLTPRGYAIVANGMIQAINKKYGSTIPELNINLYPGVKFPN